VSTEKNEKRSFSVLLCRTAYYISEKYGKQTRRGLMKTDIKGMQNRAAKPRVSGTEK